MAERPGQQKTDDVSSSRAVRASKEAKEEAVRTERDEIRRQKRLLGGKVNASTLSRFVRSNIVTVLLALFLPTILGVAFFMGGSVLVEKTVAMKWGWGMAAVYLGLLFNIPWARYVVPRFDRKLGKGAKGEEPVA